MQTNTPASITTALRLTPAALVPMLVVGTIACTIVGMIGFIVVRAVQTHGLLPRPTQLAHYRCDGFGTPVQMAFRHGLEVVQLQTGGRNYHGTLLNGKIRWQVRPGDKMATPFAMPTEVLYDDARGIRLLASDQSQHRCTLTLAN